MSALTLVPPAQIEDALKKMWEKLAKENKTRASLFNLIVYTHQNPRSDFMRSRVQKIIDNFPCRVLFITHDRKKREYLKTAVSVITPQGKDAQFACDHIDIGVGGKSIKKTLFVLLPILIPDLPTYLLWAENPCKERDLLSELEKLASHLIFDSETSENLSHFAKSLLACHKEKKEVGDLNWARTESWREMIAASFFSSENLRELMATQSIVIEYNAAKTPFFIHFKIQALYLQAWLTSRLKKKKISFKLKPVKRKDVMGGGIISMEFSAKKGFSYSFCTSKEDPHKIIINRETKEKCDLPRHFFLSRDVLGLSLTKEIIYKGTSNHFLDALKTIAKL